MFEGRRVVTLAQIDAVHGRPAGTASNTFRRNRRRFVEGRHYVSFSADVIRRLKLGHLIDGLRYQGDVTLMFEHGYLLLVKTFTDDLAWQVQEQLIDGYFRAAAHAQAINLTQNELIEVLTRRFMPLADSTSKAVRAEASQGGRILAGAKKTKPFYTPVEGKIAKAMEVDAAHLGRMPKAQMGLEGIAPDDPMPDPPGATLRVIVEFNAAIVQSGSSVPTIQIPAMTLQITGGAA